MEDVKFTLKSGVVLTVGSSEFSTAMALVKTIKKATFGMPPQSDLSSAIFISEEVEQATFRCFNRVTYDGVKLTKGLFDDPKYEDRIRGDYFEICSRVIEVNCNPFFGRAFSSSEGQQKIPA
jgi:hypothetical protein